MENEFWGFFPSFFKIYFFLLSLYSLSEEEGKGWVVPFSTVIDAMNGEQKHDRLMTVRNNIIMSPVRREVY